MTHIAYTPGFATFVHYMLQYACQHARGHACSERDACHVCMQAKQVWENHKRAFKTVHDYMER